MLFIMHTALAASALVASFLACRGQLGQDVGRLQGKKRQSVRLSADICESKGEVSLDSE